MNSIKAGSILIISGLLLMVAGKGSVDSILAISGVALEIIGAFMIIRIRLVNGEAKKLLVPAATCVMMLGMVLIYFLVIL